MLVEVPVEEIRPNPEQPRTVFDEDEIQELAQSISSVGLKQPITVKYHPDQDGKTYTLVMGERRLRATKLLGLATIKAIVEDGKIVQKDLLIEAMIENVQRKNMNPVDEAEGYLRLKTNFKMSNRAISKETGVSEARIHTMLKVASLEDPIKELIKNKKLPGSSDAIEALLSVEAGKVRIEFAQTAAARGATIKMMQSAARILNSKRIKAAATETIKEKDIPAVSVTKSKIKKSTLPLEERISMSDWDALKQAGKIPPWQLFKQQVQATCNNCSLRSIASPATCSDCPLVDMVVRMMETANV